MGRGGRASPVMLSGGWRYRSLRALPSDEAFSLLIPVQGKGQLNVHGGDTWQGGPGAPSPVKGIQCGEGRL